MDTLVLKTIAVIGGFLAGAYILEKVLPGRKKGEDEKKLSFKEFSQEQKYYDVLGGQDVTQWFREKSKEISQPIMMLMKPTKENLRKTQIMDAPEDLDENTNLLQLVMEENGKTRYGRLISFSRCSDLVKENLEKENGILFFQKKDENKEI